MKFNIVLQQPIQPRVEKVVLELSAAELVSLARIVGHTTGRPSEKPLPRETAAVKALKVPGESTVYGTLDDAMGAAGLRSPFRL